MRADPILWNSAGINSDLLVTYIFQYFISIINYYVHMQCNIDFATKPIYIQAILNSNACLLFELIILTISGQMGF